MGRQETIKRKSEFVERIKGKLDSSKGVILTDFKGLLANEVSELRKSLKRDGAEFKVTKNTLLERAIERTKYSDISKFIEGPTALIYVYEDPAVVTKKLIQFSKANKKFKVRGGYLENVYLNKEDLEEYSRLPSYDEMMGIAVGAIASPVSSFISLLNNLMSSLVTVINEIKDKSEKG